MKNRCFKRINGEYARIGRFDWNISSPLFGKYYIDLQTPTGSDNTDEVPCGVSLETCLEWLSDHDFEELDHPVIAKSGYPIPSDKGIIYFSR